MIDGTHGEKDSLNGRLRLPASGIYRDSAIPRCKSKSIPAGWRLTPPPALVWPRKSTLRLHPCIVQNLQPDRLRLLLLFNVELNQARASLDIQADGEQARTVKSGERWQGCDFNLDIVSAP